MKIYLKYCISIIYARQKFWVAKALGFLFYLDIEPLCLTVLCLELKVKIIKKNKKMRRPELTKPLTLLVKPFHILRNHLETKFGNTNFDATFIEINPSESSTIE